MVLKSGIKMGTEYAIQVIVCFVVLTLFAGVVVGGASLAAKATDTPLYLFGYNMGEKVVWVNDVEIVSDLNDHTVKTVSDGWFIVAVPNRTMLFYINATTTDGDYLIGMFSVDYRLAEDLETGEKQVNVIYSLPDDWMVTHGEDLNVTLEEKFRNPPIQKQPRRDPTFYRGVDFSEEIPFSEIEVTTDFVTKYLDTNETEYSFYVRVKEDSDSMNLKETSLIVPDGYEVKRG